MIGLFHTLNNLAVFDTSRWPKRELLSRTAGIAAVGFFVVRKILQLKNIFVPNSTFFARLPGLLAGKYEWSALEFTHYDLWMIVWAIETGILTAYIISFLTRRDSVNLPKGFIQVVYPFIVAGTPFLISMTDYTYGALLNHYPDMYVFGTPINVVQLYYGLVGMLIFGGLINLVGLIMLRRAFTIMTDARVLIRTGLFGVVRHPLYTGHFIMFFAVTALHYSYLAWGLYAFFFVNQIIRAYNEERKLSETFEEYNEYRKTTGMFLPKLFRFNRETKTTGNPTGTKQ